MKCPKCNYENEDGAPFCNMCYNVLNKPAPAAAAAAPGAAPQRPAPRGYYGGDPDENVSENTLKYIKAGWTAALVCGSFTLLAVIVGTFVPSIGAIVGKEAYIDIVLVFALAFGIRAESRTAATLMFLYYAAAKIDLWIVSGKLSGIFISGVFIYYFFRAMMAAFPYHKEVKA